MILNNIVINRPEQRVLPKNLADWLGKPGLLKVTLDGVQTVDWTEVDRPTGPPAHRPQMLLTLLAYAYSTGVYGSREIVEATVREPTMRYICARTYPDWLVLRRFRRQHRA